MTQKQDKVREEFDKEIKKAIRRHKTFDLETLSALEYDIYETSWSFIQKALQAERERVMEEVFNAYQNKVSKRGFEDFMKLSWILRKVLDSLTQTKKK